MRPSSAVLLILGIPLLLAASLPDPSPQAAGGMNAQAAPAGHVAPVPGSRAASGEKVSGLKMIVRNSFGEMTMEYTVYIESDRKRREYQNAQFPGRSNSFFYMHDENVRYGPHLALITRCDLGQTLDLNLDSGEYAAKPYPPTMTNISKAEADALRQKAPQQAETGNATQRVETTTADTGERKQVFGHIARHVITTTRTVPLEGSKAVPLETQVDGWYIDLNTHVSCEPKLPANNRTFSYMRAGIVPVEKIDFVSHGQPETGFPVEMKLTRTQTITLPDGTIQQHAYTNHIEVTLLEQGPLDPALFTIPNGFRKVTEIEHNPPLSFTAKVGMAWDQFVDEVSRLFE